tara:strand:- start:155 stop:679 length:525 start_codon:yes stop_codon:yes gene_type:complete
MKKIILPAVILAAVACGDKHENNENPANKTQDSTVVVEENVEVLKFGEDITEDGAMSGEEFLLAFAGKDSMEAKVKAPIVEVCQKKGCWMDLQLTPEQNMTIRFKDYGFFVPKDASGKIAIVEGIAKIDTISVAELKHYAEDRGASQAEIDSITQPEVTLELIAKGVILKDKEE